MAERPSSVGEVAQRPSRDHRSAPVGPPRTTIRPGRVEDAGALHELGAAVVPATYAPLDPAYAELMLREWWSVENLARSLAALPHWVAQDDTGRLVGLANLGEHDGTPTMWKLYVHPDAQGTGLGTALLDEALAVAGDRPLEVEVVAGNDAAEAFYHRHGFVEFRRTPEAHYPAMTLIWMRRPSDG